MNQPIAEHEELRINIERLRTLLETLVVRGLRACGPDDLAQLRSYTEHLEQVGAGHVSSTLRQLLQQIETDDRGSAKTLLIAQTSVRLLERLLTLMTVKSQYMVAMTDENEETDDLEDEDDE